MSKISILKTKFVGHPAGRPVIIGSIDGKVYEAEEDKKNYIFDVPPLTRPDITWIPKGVVLEAEKSAQPTVPVEPLDIRGGEEPPIVEK